MLVVGPSMTNSSRQRRMRRRASRSAAEKMDRVSTEEAGRRAGMRRALARWGFGDPREEKWDFAAVDFTTLAEYLEQTLQEEGRTA